MSRPPQSSLQQKPPFLPSDHFSLTQVSHYDDTAMNYDDETCSGAANSLTNQMNSGVATPLMYIYYTHCYYTHSNSVDKRVTNFPTSLNTPKTEKQLLSSPTLPAFSDYFHYFLIESCREMCRCVYIMHVCMHECARVPKIREFHHSILASPSPFPFHFPTLCINAARKPQENTHQ